MAAMGDHSTRGPIAFLLVFISFVCAQVTNDANGVEGPAFTQEPPSLVEFSNSTGTKIECRARGNPRPSVTWRLSDGSAIVNVSGLRRIFPNGTLVLLPFKAEDYRQDVHAAIYTCAAKNPVGTVISREVAIRAVTMQPFDVYVYNVYIIRGNTAVIRCHVPSFLTEYVEVVAWIRDGAFAIQANGIEKDGKYSVLPSGELLLRQAGPEDAQTSFRCKARHKLTGETKISVTAGKLFVTDGVLVELAQLSKWQFALTNGVDCSQNWGACRHIYSIEQSESCDQETSGHLTPLSFMEPPECPGDPEPEGNVPPRMLIHQTSVRTEEGKSAIIPCVSNGHPVPEVKWFTSVSGQVKAIVDGEHTRTVQGALLISDVQLADAGKYICESVNAAGTQRMETELKVYGGLSAVVIPSIAVVDMGHKASFTCEVSGFPVKNIQWFRDGKQLPTAESILNRNNATLMLKSITPSDKGMYQCFVSNDFETVQAAAQLKLGDSPPELLRTFQDQTLRPGAWLSLICEATGTPMPQITWTLDDMALPMGSYKDRVINDNVVSWFNVSAVKTEDGGVYKCDAKNRKGSAQHSTRIHVYGKLTARTRPKFSAISGETVWINCPVYGYPVDGTTWEKGDETLPAHLRQVILRNGTLRLENVQRGRDSGKYTCVVRNKKGETARGTVDVNVMVPPKITPFSFQEDLVREGSRARLQCVVSEGDIPLTIRWLKDGEPILPALGISIRDIDEYSSILMLPAISPRHNGNYTCVAANGAATSRYTTKLAVNVPPHWLVKPQDSSALVGNAITIDCQAEGFPKPTVQWMKARGNDPNDQRDLVATNGHMQILANGSLRIPYLSEANEGYYFCLASNGIGDGLSKAMYLDIHRPAKFLTKHTNQTFNINGEIHLVCEASGDLPINFTWKLHNKAIDVYRNNRYKIRSKENATKDSAISELFIANTRKNDSNVFTCTAQNAYGTDESFFQIFILDIPDPPIIHGVKSADNGSIEVTWKIPHDGSSPITKYWLQYKEEKDNWKSAKNLTLSPSQNWTLINGLKPYSPHSVRMAAVNNIGASNFSNELSFKTDEQAPTGSPLNVEIEPVDKQSLRITWKPPERSTWNGVIRGYRVGYKVSGAKSEFNFISIEIPEDFMEDLIYQITELDMYTQYTIIVQAYNGKGHGPSSPELQVMTSEDVPKEAPRNVRCSPLSTNTIYIIWDPISPENANGILRGYKVLYKSVDDWYDVSHHSKTSEVPKLTLQGLEVNTNYSIEVAAFTKVGDGSKSQPIYCKTHEDVPSAPGDIKVLPASSDTVLVAWKPPLKPNGAVTKYNVYVRPIDDDEETGSETRYSKDAVSKPDGLDDTNIHTSRDDLIYQITGLDKNRRYEFWITAVSGVGEGPRSRVVTQLTGDQTIAAQSAAFDDVIKTTWKRDLTLSCRAVGQPQPSKTWIKGGKPINSHDRMQVGPDGSLVIQKVNLEDSGNYTCMVNNKYGTDEVKYAVVVLVPPSSPTLGVYSKTTSSLQLKWHSGSNGGDPLRGYLLYYRKDGDKWGKKELYAEQESHMLENLACGATYQLYMEPYNNIGVGEPSDVITITTDGDALEPPPKDQLIHEGATFLSLHLDAWPSTGCPIKNFTVEYRKTDVTSWTTVKKGIKPSEKRIVIPGLTPATLYHVRVTAYSNGGPTEADYVCFTLTAVGGTVSPNQTSDQKGERVIWLSLDWILIAASIILALILVVVVVTLICLRRRAARKQKSRTRKSHHTSVESFVHLHGNNPNSRVYSSLTKGTMRKDYDPSPYASSTLPGCSPDMRTQGRLSVPSGVHSGKSSTDLMWLDPSTRPLSDVGGNYPSNAAAWSQYSNDVGSPPTGSKRPSGNVKNIQSRPLPPTPQRNKSLTKKRGKPLEETVFVFPNEEASGQGKKRLSSFGKS